MVSMLNPKCIAGYLIILTAFLTKPFIVKTQSSHYYHSPSIFRTPGFANALPCGAYKLVKPRETVVIESPNFSNSTNYPNSFSCRWRFLFPGCTLQLTCPSFRLNDFLCFDYLEVKDGSGKGSRRYCGKRGPNNETLNREAEVLFRSSPFFNSVGFRCQLMCTDEENPSSGGTSLNPGAPGSTSDNLPTKPIAAKSNCSCGEALHGVKIVNGQQTEIGEYPWMAGLVRTGSKIPFCGGSLINDRYILTAAHCVSGRTPKTLEIILNEHELTIDNELPTIRKQIETIITHKNYAARLDFDAALIKLKEPVDIQENIVPVCLPLDEKVDYLKEKATVSGWGATSEGGKLSPFLQKVEVDVISNADCMLAYPLVISERMMCAYRESQDACQGDSGGPLMHAVSTVGNKTRIKTSLNKLSALRDPSIKTINFSKYTQIGVVSWGQGCARKGKPGVYSRITEFMPWIQAVAADGSFCNS